MDRSQHVLTATLRSNPHYELVAFDRLSASEQALLGPLAQDPDFHGILRPHSASTPLPIKGVSHATARLFTTLTSPGTPAFDDAGAMGVDAAARSITQLILDSVLEIQHDTAFVSGPLAAPLVAPRRLPDLTTTVTARLSRAALQYADALPIDDALTLSARMYFYNRTPVSPDSHRRYSDPSSIRALLGIDDGSLTIDYARWVRSGQRASEREGWFQWRRAGSAASAGPRTTPTFKLYVSPRHESLRDVTRAALPIITRSPASAFKLGSTEQQLCRPDKIVAYFDSRDALDETARALSTTLRGATAHGVPFTASVTQDGLLSWGVDPPPAPQVMWRERESWRLWVTNRLAIALLAARRTPPAGMTAWEFAIVRLELDGVDITTWTPNADVWTAGTPAAA